METEIRIENCKLQITRRGSWWGVSRRDLARRAVDVLPELVLARLENRLATRHFLQEPVEIVNPIQIRVTLSRNEFLELMDSAAASSRQLEEHLRPRIDQAIIESGLDQLVYAQCSPGLPAPPETKPNRLPRLGQSIQPPAGSATVKRRLLNHPSANPNDNPASPDAPNEHGQSTSCPTSLLEWLTRYYQQGSLGIVLGRIDLNALWCWHEKLLLATRAGSSARQDRSLDTPSDADASSTHNNPAPRIPGTVTAEDFRDFVQNIAMSLPSNPDLKKTLCCRIFVIVEACSRWRFNNGLRELQVLLDQYLPLELDGANNDSFPPLASRDKRHPKPEYNTNGATNQRNNAAANKKTSAGKHSLSLPCLPVSKPFDVEVSSVLPFIVLNSLSNTGFLEALTVAMDAAGLHDSLAAFATAFAYKVLDKPGIGGLRNQELQTSAAVFACSSQPVPMQDIHHLADHADHFVSALNGLLADKLLENADESHALYLAQVKSGGDCRIFASESSGNFPVAIVESVANIRRLLMRSNETILLIDPCLANQQFLQELEDNDLTFVIDVPPTRGENLRSLRRRDGVRFWTNDATSSHSQLSRAGMKIAASRESAESFWQALAIERRSTPAAKPDALENSLTLATGVGLAQIAWDLWREKEATDPLLALERFQDLSGQVRVSRGHVRVSLPLGKRSVDLAEHGYLNDIANVPWLNGRQLTFSQG